MPDEQIGVWSRLPFVALPVMWSVTPSGQWARDNRTGARYADQFIKVLQEHPNYQPLFGHIVRDMVAAGRVTGIEIGFCQRIAAELSG